MELLGCSTVVFCWFSMSRIGDLRGTVRHSQPRYQGTHTREGRVLIDRSRREEKVRQIEFRLRGIVGFI